MFVIQCNWVTLHLNEDVYIYMYNEEASNIYLHVYNNERVESPLVFVYLVFVFFCTGNGIIAFGVPSNGHVIVKL